MRHYAKMVGRKIHRGSHEGESGLVQPLHAIYWPWADGQVWPARRRKVAPPVDDAHATTWSKDAVSLVQELDGLVAVQE